MSLNNKTIQIRDLKCELIPGSTSDHVIYMIYPEMVEFQDSFIENLTETYNIPTVLIYIPSNQWNNYLTPWPEPGEAKGFPSFSGQASEFLKVITNEIIPQTDKILSLNANPRRYLMGVSLYGLFTLWTWLNSDIFHSIACLSGSFWYNGFIQWFEQQAIPQKTGGAFFLLGRDEPKAAIKAYRPVGTNTQAIVAKLKAKGIDTTFEWVQGNHFANPLERAQLGYNFLAKR